MAFTSDENIKFSPDKGYTMVIINKLTYEQTIQERLNDAKYTQLNKDYKDV